MGQAGEDFELEEFVQAGIGTRQTGDSLLERHTRIDAVHDDSRTGWPALRFIMEKTQIRLLHLLDPGVKKVFEHLLFCKRKHAVVDVERDVWDGKAGEAVLGKGGT